MRLINTETGKFEKFTDSSKAPLYAILSHTWDQPPGHEQTYQDVVKIQEKCGLLAPSEADPNGPQPATVLPEVLCASTSDYTPSQSTGPVPLRLPRLSPSILARLEYLFITSLARPLLYFLQRGPSSPLDLESQREVEPAHSPPNSTRPSIWDPSSGLSKKIWNACKVARDDGYRYIWVDSCCIDKSSSSELSEAINSMFNWYRGAQICYAFLSDVTSGDNVRAQVRDMPLYYGYQAIDSENAKASSFRNSRWFKRAWTLQELIAPRVVVFLSQHWKGLGTKDSLADLIEEITYIDRDVLTHRRALADESVAERMRWASSREATRVEDEAYALFGIFGITMTTIYGEGRHAFQRLQEAILQRIPDRTLFAWCNGWHSGGTAINVSVLNTDSSDFKGFIYSDMTSPFATSPSSFGNFRGKIKALSTQDFDSLQLPVEEYAPTPHGIRTKTRLIPLKSLAPNFQVQSYYKDHTPSTEPWYLVPLGFQQDNDNENQHILGKLCYIAQGKSGIQLLQIPSSSRYSDCDGHHVLICVDLRVDLRGLVTEDPIDVYLPLPAPSIIERKPAIDKSNTDQATTILKFSPWAPSVMPPHYTISEYPPGNLLPKEDLSLQGRLPPPLSLLLMSETAEPVTKLLIQYRHIPCTIECHSPVFPVPRVLGYPNFIPPSPPKLFFGALIEARIWILSPGTPFDSGIPPYNSAVWGAREDDSTLPTWYVSVPVTQSGEEPETWITLRLWLGIAKIGDYHAHVEVAADKDVHDCTHLDQIEADSRHRSVGLKMVAGFYSDDEESGSDTEYYEVKSRQSMLSPLETALLCVPEPHPEFRFTMLGSAKRELEAQGYSIHLDSVPGGNTGNSNSHSLIISNSTFTISIRYYHNRYTPWGTRFPQFILVARVTLEFNCDNSLQGCQDGPYVARWLDKHDWLRGYTRRYIYLETPTEELRLTLDWDRAWVSEYYLVVDLKRNHSRSQTADEPRDGASQAIPFLLVDPHDHICLVLPTHIRRALQSAGYEVSFEGSKNNPYHLTLSDDDNNLTITIEYFYTLSTNKSSGLQQLTFQACVKASVLQSSQDEATEPQTVTWNAWRQGQDWDKNKKEGWLWMLRDEDVKLILPSGLEMTLRLSLYLVWLSEYCITVEVKPASLLSPTGRDDRMDREGDDGEMDSEGDDEMESEGEDEMDIQVGRSGDMQEAAVREVAEEENRDSDAVAPAIASPETSAEDVEMEVGAGEGCVISMAWDDPELPCHPRQASQVA